MYIACPNCQCIQHLTPFVDKKAWECDNCLKAWEVSADGIVTRHQLAGNATRTAEHVCEGPFPHRMN